MYLPNVLMGVEIVDNLKKRFIINKKTCLIFKTLNLKMFIPFYPYSKVLTTVTILKKVKEVYDNNIIVAKRMIIKS